MRPIGDRLQGATWRRRAFDALTRELADELPTAGPLDPARLGVFLANGGAVWFEAVYSRSGMVELATPECRGPSELIAYQRAMERLACQAAARVGVSLIKNDQDSTGETYGAQENYQVELDTLLERWGWRLGLVGLLPLIVLSAVLRFVLYGLYWVYLLFGLLAVAMAFAWSKEAARRVAIRFWGEDLIRHGAEYVVLPDWLERLSRSLMVLAASPVLFGLWMLASCTWLRRRRRQLSAFLVSRVLFAGTGSVDRSGGFLLADKAPAINVQLGYAGLFGQHPIFPLGHLVKGLLGSLGGSIPAYGRLFRRRHRLQIALGDSNRAEHAEYLKVGATMLVLDAAEAGYLDDAPSFVSPIEALRTYTRDVSLTRGAACRDGHERTALEVQRYYFKRCFEFVLDSGEDSPEAKAVLARWEETLAALEASAATGTAHESLVGSIDWVTKQYFLDRLEPSAAWHVRKKADIRYHELSSEGYFEALAIANLVPRVVDERAVEQAMRLPPRGTAATKRGRMIREFSSSDYTLLVGWERLIIRVRGGQRSIRLDHGEPKQ